MRILVDVPPEQVDALNALAEQTHASTTEVIREALQTYISRKRLTRAQFAGLWAPNPETQDVQGFLDHLRSEWAERFPTEPKPRDCSSIPTS